MLAVFAQNEEEEWVHFGNTEIILNNLNPQFETKIMVPYNNKQPKKMRFEIYHISKVKEKEQLNKQKLLGSIEVSLSEIVFEVRITRMSGRVS